MIKKILKFIGIFLLLYVIGFILSVIFFDVTVSGQNRKVFFGFDKFNKRFIVNGFRSYELDGLDGPYVIAENENFQLIRVVKNHDAYEVDIKTVERDTELVFVCEVENQDRDQFEVVYSDINGEIPKTIYTTDQKIVALSDIEGNFNALSSFLMQNAVIDENLKWAFGKGHLVLVGDFVDRGDNVTACLWLIYQLEKEARKAGGQVHFILGNHEAMNLQGKLRYLSGKYIGLAQRLGKHNDYVQYYKHFLNDEFVLGKWLKSKNTLEKINRTLFVHAGISTELLAQKLSLDSINQIVRTNIAKDLYGKVEGDKIANLIMGRKGPLWYRGMVRGYKDYYKKMDPVAISKILKYYQVDQIVIGHTVVDDISIDMDGQIVRIDVKHGKEKISGKTKGILIDKSTIHKIDDRKSKQILKTFKSTNLLPD